MFLKLTVFYFVLQFGCNVCFKDSLYEAEFEQEHKKDVYYFAYGSNMLNRKIKRLVNGVQCKGPAFLRNYRLDFDTHVNYWNGALATITKDPEATVWGVLWSMQQSDAKSFNRLEFNTSNFYIIRHVNIYTSDLKEYSAFTHVAKRPPRKLPPWILLPKERRPSITYLKVLIAGAIENDLPKEYIKRLIDVPYNGKLADQKLRRLLNLPVVKGNSLSDKLQYQFELDLKL